ncbi:nicotinate-nucleotide--dimethylbenzimidazole phosphoribosyltransferase [Bartonella sp. HY761]|uniref:nicotinate-nucleotide--dimethylbenzimidazole phosphoribosyltransferase n=1 Tax=Bartonella sp. HY761 TaxID=2979330 RepID=UPI003FA3444F
MSNMASPFDDFRALLHNLPEQNQESMAQARLRQQQLTKPVGSLGRLEDIAIWLAGWRGQDKPVITRPLVAVFAGNHGVVEENVTPFPQSVTRQMVDNFAAGGAAINQICITNDLGLKIYDLALDYPTMNITKDAAMDVRGCAATMAFGMESIAGGTDLLCIGEMGIGNTTVAAALSCGLFGGDVEEWVGPGTGSTGDYFTRKVEAVRKAVARNEGHLEDPFEVLRRLGGREFAAIVGAILAARMEKIPVILDGYVVTAAAAILYRCLPAALDHCLVGQLSSEPGHKKLLEIMGKKPILDLGMHLGEGTGAALAAGVVKAATLCHSQMATFDQAGIDKKAAPQFDA